MNCVKCDGILNKKKIEGIEVDQCPKCAGIWFDFGELEDILKKEDTGALNIQPAEEKLDYDSKRGKCPRCGGDGNMIDVISAKDDHIHIDTCPVCYGKWLDGGELEKLKDDGVISTISSWIKSMTG